MLAHVSPGDCLLLEGPVGAGKSTFARAMIQAQMEEDGQIEEVPSPTFTLIQTYETSKATFAHVDLYRLSDVSELEELGLSALLDDAICLIEWPQRLGEATPERALNVSISVQNDEPEEFRHLRLLPRGTHWDWINEIPVQET